MPSASRGPAFALPGEMGCNRGIRFFLALLALVPAFMAGASGPPEKPCPHHLFILGRSKNANIVVYDANRGPDGDLAASEPVLAYWLLGGKNGQREELNLLERQRAYGVEVTPGEAPGTFEMVFKAGRKRRFTIRMLNGCPVATASIGGHDGILRRMFLESKEGGLQPRVEYVEFFAEDLATGEALYEKFVPGN